MLKNQWQLAESDMFFRTLRLLISKLFPIFAAETDRLSNWSAATELITYHSIFSSVCYLFGNLKTWSLERYYTRISSVNAYALA